MATLMSFLAHMSASLTEFLRRCRQAVGDVAGSSRRGADEDKAIRAVTLLNRVGINSSEGDCSWGFIV